MNIEDRERLLHLLEISRTNNLREFARWLLSRMTMEEAQMKLNSMYEAKR